MLVFTLFPIATIKNNLIIYIVIMKFVDSLVTQLK